MSYHKYESMIAKIGNEQIIETNRITLLGILIEPELKFESYLKLICNKALNKLNVLSRQCAMLPFYRRKILMAAFFDPPFSYCLFLWMFHSRSMNARINNLHNRTLPLIYQDNTSSFQELLLK